jgi:hypothetical protein
VILEMIACYFPCRPARRCVILEFHRWDVQPD